MHDRNNSASVPQSEPIPPDPDSPTFAREFKSYIRNILLASPYFPRMYADVVIDRAPNSNLAKVLRANYSKILEKVNMAVRQQQLQRGTRFCTHIKVNGVPCGSPALRGEQFCYFHQRMHRSVRIPPQARLHPIAMIEDEESIQAALMEVINALMRNTIDLKRASLILRALHIAVKNARRVHFDLRTDDMVRDIPEYAQPPEQAPDRTPLDPPFTAEVPVYEPTASDRRQAARAQLEADRQAAVRASLERAAREVASGPAYHDAGLPRPVSRASESQGSSPKAAIPSAEICAPNPSQPSNRASTEPGAKVLPTGRAIIGGLPQALPTKKPSTAVKIKATKERKPAAHSLP